MNTSQARYNIPISIRSSDNNAYPLLADTGRSVHFSISRTFGNRIKTTDRWSKTLRVEGYHHCGERALVVLFFIGDTCQKPLFPIRWRLQNIGSNFGLSFLQPQNLPMFHCIWTSATSWASHHGTPHCQNRHVDLAYMAHGNLSKWLRENTLVMSSPTFLQNTTETRGSM